VSEKVQKTEQEWKAELTPEQYKVLREKGTERAFTGRYHASKESGVYRCAGCGEELPEVLHGLAVADDTRRNSRLPPGRRMSSRRETPRKLRQDDQSRRA